MQSKNLVVLGSGLIGASLAKAAREAGCVESVSVVNRSLSTSRRAVDLGVADAGYSYDQLPDICAELMAGDLVVVAVPVKSYTDIFALIGDRIPQGVVLTDVGSTKVEVINAARQQWGDNLSFFVPGHPIAGSEKSGVDAADADLFKGRRTIITPLSSNSEQAVQLLSDLWASVGAEVDLMDAQHHDDILAATSHLPHFLAYSLVDSLYTLDQKSEVFRYAASGFRDFTRIAESDPIMWRDVFLANKKALISQLKNFETHVEALRLAIESEDSETIELILERSQAARKFYMESNNAKGN